MILDHLPIIQVIAPLIGALLCALTRSGKVAWIIAAVVSLLMPLVAIGLLQQVLSQGVVSYAIGGWLPPVGIEYRVDLLNVFVLLIVSIVGAVMIPFAARSVAAEIPEHKQSWFYSMYLLCMCGLLGITITGDAFNAFVFLEISSLATYTLIALGSDRRALIASYQYLIVGTIGATFYIIGVGILLTVTGTLNMVDIADRLGDIGQTRPVLAALAFIIVGISLKLALFPLHVWLPNAYAYAPSFATSFLAATATKVAVYLFVRFVFGVFGTGIEFGSFAVADVLLVLSIFAMFGASIVAVFENNIKRALAYSSVSQIGYMTLGIALGNLTGLTGGLVHLFNHALIKGGLFMAVGAVAYRTGTMRISELGGIGRRMPLTMGAFTVAGMAIIGVPGTVGFVSKYLLAVASFEKGYWWLPFLIVASSLIAVLYIGRIVEIAWFREPKGPVATATEAPLSMLIPIWILALACVLFGWDTELSAGLAERAAAFMMGAGG
ncbi:MAG: monovalent cation/H+ antiporter subunit D family protein [Flavobacteriaceae bacterium]